jgi:hypothetical protein
VDLYRDFYPIGILLIVIVGLGIWVNRTGKPYNGILFNIHKLLALGAVILTAVRIFRLDPLATFPSNVLFLIGLAVLMVITLFATGAVMSIQVEVKSIFQWIHGISPVVITASIVIALILIQSKG